MFLQWLKEFWRTHCAVIKKMTPRTQTSLCTGWGFMYCMRPRPISDPIPSSVNVKFIQSLCLLSSSAGRNLSYWPWWGLLCTHGQILRPVRPISRRPSSRCFSIHGFIKWHMRFCVQTALWASPWLTPPGVQDSFKCALSPSFTPPRRARMPKREWSQIVLNQGAPTKQNNLHLYLRSKVTHATSISGRLDKQRLVYRAGQG